MLFSFLGLSRQLEILIIITLGTIFLSLDFSVFHLKSNLADIWKIDPGCSKCLESGFKYVISAVVLARAVSLHAFIACYVVMLWPAIFKEKPNLMLPWLFLGLIRCLILNAVTFAVGTFICQKTKGFSPTCLDYILAQIIEHGPSGYAWFSVLGFYKEINGDHSSSQSSVDSNCSMAEQDGMEDSSHRVLEQTRSYSLSGLDLDYLYSSRVRKLQGNLSIEILLKELGDAAAQKRVIWIDENSYSSDASDAELPVVEKAMKHLGVSFEDVLKAKQTKNRLGEVLKEISLDDVDRSGYHYLSKKEGKSRSHTGNSNCHCYIKRRLNLKQSNQTILESEIRSVVFNDEAETKGKGCRANNYYCNQLLLSKNDLNTYRVVEGSKFGFIPNFCLRELALRRKYFQNYEVQRCRCAVTMLMI